MEYEITLDDILKQDGGQQYLESVYPDIYKCFQNPNHKISIRDDDSTASAGVFKHKEKGWWMLKDFGGGGDNKAKTALQVCMDVNGLSYGAAFKVLAEFYGISIKYTQASASYNSRPARSDEQPKQVTITKYKEFTQAEILTILSPKAWEGIEFGGLDNKNDDKVRFDLAIQLFKYYHIKSVESYEQVSEDGKKVNIFTSNPEFPIFAFDEGEFQKIYKPKDEKQYRFLYAGKKPENFIHGLAQHKQFISGNVKQNEDAYNAALESGQKVKLGEKLEEKFREIILCSGGSDALNVAALGYKVIWLNSETAKIDKEQFKAINSICTNFYNLPDIDMTGKESAKSLAFRYLDIRTIWLPATLAQQTDARGNACKDVRDYLKNNNKKAFKKLVETALPFKFWDEQPAYDKEGNRKIKFGRPQMVYELNHVCTYNFLQMNGFYRYPTDKAKEGYVFIQIDGNKVTKVDSNIIKNYIHNFLKERQLPEDLRNMMYRSPQLSETSLSNLEDFEPNFKHFGRDFQYIFFDNTIWKVTGDAIEVVKTPNVYVWDFKIIKIETVDKNNRVVVHKPKIIEDMFKISGNMKEGWDIDMKDTNSDFVKFLTNTCRIHWRTELEERMNFWQLTERQRNEYQLAHDLSDEQVKKLMSFQSKEKQDKYKEQYQFRLDGSLLTAEEIKEQKLALVNRIFSIGYMLHRYKDLAKPWALFLMDYRISEEGASNGRAGKGILAKAFYKMLWHTWKDGRKQDMFDYEHIWEPIEKWVTDLIHIEDWGEFQPFPRLYGPLTSSLIANPKGKTMITYKYEEYGKFLIDTNFSDRYMDGSSKGRKLHGVFSDYYHEDLEYYSEVRTPLTELGGRIFDDWNGEQWNLFYNFMAQCLKFYLSVAQSDVKIDPPFSNIQKRNSLALMGENFRQWADNYFAGKMNDLVGRTDAYEDCRNAINAKQFTPQGFWKKMQAWAEFNEYKFNPEHVSGWKKESEHAKYGTIKKMIPNPNQEGKYTQKEYIWIEAKVIDESDIPV